MNEMINVNKDGLWLEFKKAIDYGDFISFKTRRGFNGYLKKQIKNAIGHHIIFVFSPGLGEYQTVCYKITKKDREWVK